MSTTAPNKSSYDYEPTDNSIYLKILPDTEVRVRFFTDPFYFMDSYPGEPPTEKWGWGVIVKTLDSAGKPIRTVKAYKAGVSIFKAIRTLAKDSDWGDPKEYDVKIQRVGSGKNDTKYTLIPCPKAPMSDADKKAIAEAKLDLAVLFMKDGQGTASGGNDESGEFDPFAGDN